MAIKHEKFYLKHKALFDRFIRENPDISATKIAMKMANDTSIGTPGYLADVISQGIKAPLCDIDLSEKDYDFPESYYEKSEIISIFGKSILLLNDVHIPYHDNQALKLALDYGKSHNIDTIYFNGDVLDMYGLSKFSHDPALDNFWIEVKAARKFFQTIRMNFPNQKIYYKFGNHEERLEKFIWDKAPEFSEIPEMKLESLLRFNEYEITPIQAASYARLGKLYIIHGDEFRVGGQGIFAARNFRLRANDNIIFGHFHKTQEDVVTTISGKQIGSWMVGCLCGLNPRYMPVNQWNHGFAHILTDGEGFEVHNKKIINGSIR